VTARSHDSPSILLRRVAFGTGVALLATSTHETPAEEAYKVQAFVQPAGPLTDTDPFQLVIRIEGAELPDLSVPRLPPMTGLRVVSGPSTSQQFRWVNGRASASSTVSFTLLAEKTGAAEIPSMPFRIGSTTYRTDPIPLQIVQGQTRPRSPPGAQTGPGRSRGGNEADVFLEARLGSEEVWVGQSVPFAVILRSAAEITNFQWRQIPSFSGFWTEDTQVDPNAERTRETVDGRSYVAYPLERKILMPTSAGEITIDPYSAAFQVRKRTGDVLEDFFSFGRVQDVIRKTEPVRLRVKPLPESGRPPNFGGAVGSFRISVAVDRKEAQADEAVALKLTVQGEGFLKSVSPPHLDFPPDLKVFEPKATESSSTTGGKVVSRKTWEWVLVPLVPGDVRIPPPGFSFFDPIQAAYREVRADPIQIVVRRAERGTEEAPVARGEVRLKRQEIAFIKPLRGRLADERTPAHRRPWFLAALVSPLVWIPAVIVLGRRRVRLKEDRSFARAGRAATRARKRLRSAGKRLASLDGGSFHEELSRALVEYVADRFDRSAAGLTYDVADSLLESRGVSPESRARFRACLERCDFARFVPDAGSASRKAQALGEAREIVDLVETAL